MHVFERDKLVEFIAGDGQLAAAEEVLYTVPVQRQVRIASFILSNTAAVNTNTVSIYKQASGGTSRRIFYAALSPGDTAFLAPLELEPDTEIRGEATNAAEVDWTITGFKEWSI